MGATLQVPKPTIFALLAMALALAACAGDNESASTQISSSGPSPSPDGLSEFVAEVWADNWFAIYANGELVGEDSVPITTERSFNAETIRFRAAYPLSIGIEARDFKETDSGIEYIGAGNQQMGDGGIIAQITDASTGQTVAVTNGDWSVLVIHRAPLNPSCEKDPDPDTSCRFESTAAPIGWTEPTFDSSAWESATVWSAGEVRPKGGYDDVDWDGAASLIWGSDLEIDNTVLLRLTVPSP